MINLNELKAGNTPLDNHYRLIRKIGGGGFSEVWLAEDLRSKVEVALKVYSSVQDMDNEGISMFRKEFSMVCNLNHTNILKPFTFDIFNGCPYIVLPYCEKGSATKFIGKVSADELWNFAGQVAAGLAYMHKHDIIHQDIKPGNVLVNADGQLMITDFGISTGIRKTMRRSKNLDDSARDGTMAYMSYECLNSNPINVISRDIWAFGATLYELATGDVPFGEYGGLTQKANSGKIPHIKADIPNEMKELIYHCLAFDPWGRPSADEIVAIVANHGRGTARTVSFSLKKLCISGCAAVALAIGAYFIYNMDTAYDSQPTDAVAYNPNDSIVLAQVSEAAQAVSNEREKGVEQRDDERLYMAAKQYKEAIAIPASDSTVRKAEREWANVQSVIDETYNYLSAKSAEYNDIGASSAAEEFGKRSRKLKSFVSQGK